MRFLLAHFPPNQNISIINQHRLSAEPKIRFFDIVGRFVVSEDPVHNVAPDGSASTKDGSVAHFLSEFLAILLQFAVLPSFHRSHRSGLADGQWHIAVFS